MANVTTLKLIYYYKVVCATHALIGNQTSITLSTGLYTSVAVNERLKIIGLPSILVNMTPNRNFRVLGEQILA